MVPDFCEVVFNRPLEHPFTYRIPPPLQGTLKIGQRVRVPFGKSETLGYVVDLSRETSQTNLKEIKEILDEGQSLEGDLFNLCRWMADYYFCSFGEALSLAFPAGFRKVGKIRPASLKARVSKEHGVNLEANSLSTQPFLPTADQGKSIERISQALEKKEKKVFLLHGVTASGKTEVYLQVAARAIARGGGVIVLVPEIVLAQEIVRVFQARFGNEVAIWHSKLGEKERYQEWLRIRSGQARLVIGPRSAIFTPVKNLRVVMVDEEHENAYKQSEKSPRYHGRDVAIMRASMAGAVTILGSATPSLESYYHALQGKYELIELPTRVDCRKLPEVKIIDLRNSLLKNRRRGSLFSPELKEAIAERLSRREQVILFLNRRGFAFFILCQACGHVFRCRHCQVALTYHRDRDRGLCHYCGYREKIEEKCPRCKEEAINFFGLGTEKIEEEVKNLFPSARVKRLDSDVTSKRNAASSILAGLRNRRIDILIGTQMAAKGLDFPYVTLVGVILADGSLNVPDFRAGERTFQLLTQVAGRSGRGKGKGFCLIQTYSPQNYAITNSTTHGYAAFYEEEIKFRQELHYPPFCRFIRLLSRGKIEARVREAAERLARIINERAGAGTFLMGPSQAPLARIKGKYRWQFCLKTREISRIRRIIREAIARESQFLKGVELVIDADPLDMF